MFRKLFGLDKKISAEEEERLETEWFDRKSKMMETVLGKEHDMVMHALIPYEVGGTLDLYYYPNGIPGTAIATKELSYACRDSSTNDQFSQFELVMFTHQELDLNQAKEPDTPFGEAHRTIVSLLNPIARYSEQATLNVGETLEFPEDFDEVGGKCLVLDDYGTTKLNDNGFGLLLVIEVYREEMDFARKNSVGALIEKLKKNGAYPYSDLNRVPVV